MENMKVIFITKKTLNQERLHENLVVSENKKKIDFEKSRRELLKIIEEYEDNCKILNKYRKNKKSKTNRKLFCL